MCNCMDDVIKQMKEMMDLEYVEPPVGLTTDKAYLEFTVKEKGKKRERKLPVLLSRCPFCGELYDEEKKS